MPPGAVDGEHSLTYGQLTPADLPELPDGFTATGRAFDLSVAEEGGEEIRLHLETGPSSQGRLKDLRWYGDGVPTDSLVSRR